MPPALVMCRAPMPVAAAGAITSLLLINDNATDGSSTFTDQSPSPKTVTNNGTTLYSSLTAPTGMTTAAKFNGSSQTLTIPAHADFAYGTGDFTIEFDFYLTSIGVFNLFFDQSNSASEEGPGIFVNSSDLPYVVVNNTAVITSGSALSINTWYNLALARVSGSTRLFINQTQVGSTYADSNNYTNTAGIVIGNDKAADAFYNGRLDCIRIKKGIGLYTSSGYSAPTRPLT